MCSRKKWGVTSNQFWLEAGATKHNTQHSGLSTRHSGLKMDRIVITGGKPLRGEVRVSGAKNAALPILASTILGGGECVITNVPRVVDVVTMSKLLDLLGASVRTEGSQVAVSVERLRSTEAPYE